MPSLSSQPAERSKRLIRSELLRRGLPSSSSAESTSWIEVKARLYVVNSRQLLLEIRGEDVYERVELHTNSTAFQTTLIEHHLSFEILSSSRILHLAAASLEACAAWVAVVNDSVMQYAAYPPEPLFWETLNREVGLEYAVTFRERRSLGVCIGKVGQLVAVESSHNSEIRAGSVVFAINGECVFDKPYDHTTKLLQGWTAPLTLSLIAAPERRGYLWRQVVHKRKSALVVSWRRMFFELSEGSLKVADSSQPSAKVLGDIPLLGAVVIVSASSDARGKHRCFRVCAGLVSLAVMAESQEDMWAWASALYLALAISNGGGYMRALLAPQAGESPLMRAVSSGNTDVVRYLIRRDFRKFLLEKESLCARAAELEDEFTMEMLKSATDANLAS